MGDPSTSRARQVRLAWLAIAALVGPMGAPAAGDDDESLGLYRWLDRGGVVRYTPDFDRVPSGRRKTTVKVIPGSTPMGAPSSSSGPVHQIPTPQAIPGSSAGSGPGSGAATGTPADPAADPDADPFNAPSEANTVDMEPLDPDDPVELAATSWPELDARIAELETLIADDEEIIKQLISQPPTHDDDEIIHSATLREIAKRLPALQGELIELQSWRDDPDGRK
jgi:uncharacterized coiled-coil protein SlyX